MRRILKSKLKIFNIGDTYYIEIQGGRACESGSGCCNFKEKHWEVPHQGGTVFEQRLHSSEGMDHRVPGSRT